MPTIVELSRQITELLDTRYSDFSLENLPGFALTRPKLVELLVSVQFNPYTTTESASKGATDFHFETYRCTTRLYCLSLLHRAAQAWAEHNIKLFKSLYHAFIEAQHTDFDKNPILTEASFLELTKELIHLNPDQQKALVINTIISSLVLTPSVKDKMKQLLTDSSKYPEITLDDAERAILAEPAVQNDSITFLKKACGNPKLLKALYPFVIDTGDAAIDYVCKAFSAGHLRWYLYTEGNDASAYDDFRSAVTGGVFTPDVVQSWYCYWLINIAGFRGHEKDSGWRGARYLNQNTYMAIHELMYHLQLFCKIRDYPVLLEWLEARALKLQFNSRGDERLFLAHLACLTRTYEPEMGKCLEEGFSALTPELRIRIAATYHPQITEPRAAIASASSHFFAAAASSAAPEAIPVLTYLPQVFSNIENYVFKHTANRAHAKSISVQLGLQIYLHIWEEYISLRHHHAIDLKLPLSFNGLITDPILDSLLVLRSETQEAHPQLKAVIRTEAFIVGVKPESGASTIEPAAPTVELKPSV